MTCHNGKKQGSLTYLSNLTFLWAYEKVCGGGGGGGGGLGQVPLASLLVTTYKFTNK